jgi:hypothetical protein
MHFFGQQAGYPAREPDQGLAVRTGDKKAVIGRGSIRGR